MSNSARRKHFSIRAEELLYHVPRWECHIHTIYTDGTSSVEQVVKRAVELRLERIIFTEHTEPWHVSRKDWFNDYVSDIHTVRREYGDQIEIFIGIEAPSKDFEDGLGLTPEMIEMSDFILGTAHRYPGLGNRRVRDLIKDEIIDFEFRTLMALAENPNIDAIAHIGGTCQKYCCPLPIELVRQVVNTATRHGIAIEINYGYHKPLSDFVQLCIAEDARVTLGSDVHCIEDVGAIVSALREMSLRD